ncbi:hypothetical protein R0137_01170 [Congregibacter brevis]|uniref:DUF302 domain-containing protein n=1 Tax=Congregibacter brevis TaxID=3081201 RepID=A0ABZ0IEE9_9GAMM|nr:hypothetical protein R0137_01170 [Congregibacter sp. IMCC45268]
MKKRSRITKQWTILGKSLILTAVMLAGAQSSAQLLSTPEVVGSSWVYKTPGLYHNVREDLVQAIQDEGLVISYTAHLASMLTRTAEATGAKVQVYENAESLLFCSAELTYELTLNNPHNITLCPYSISIYTLLTDLDNVYLSIRAPELEQADYAAVHQLLEQIIAATLTW